MKGEEKDKYREFSNGEKGRKRTLLGTSEIVGLHVSTRSTVDTLLVTNDLGAEGFREASDGLTEVTLEEFDNTVRRGRR